MKNLKVKLFEIYSLQSELNGLINQQSGEKVKNGILDEEIGLVAKYWINQLNDVVSAEVKTLDTQREELIKNMAQLTIKVEFLSKWLSKKWTRMVKKFLR